MILAAILWHWIESKNNFQEKPSQENELEQLRAELAQKTAALEKANLEIKRLNELVIHDELTGLKRKEYLLSQLAAEFDRYQRHGQKHFSLIMLDLDHFKEVWYGREDESPDQYMGMVNEMKMTRDIHFKFSGQENLFFLGTPICGSYQGSDYGYLGSIILGTHDQFRSYG